MYIYIHTYYSYSQYILYINKYLRTQISKQFVKCIFSDWPLIPVA